MLLHTAAFSGSSGVSLGDRYVGAFLKWFVDCPHAINLICERDHQMVGYVFGAPDGYGLSLNRDLFPVIGVALLTRPWLLLRSSFLRQIPGRLQLLVKRRPPAADGLAVQPSIGGRYRLVGIGVDPGQRRSGIGRRLMQAFQERAWRLGYTEIQLSVYADNLGAQRLYKSCGWEQTTFNREVVHYAVWRTPDKAQA